jgi:hypothetical protein
MQFDTARQSGFELFPDAYGKSFRRAHFPLHKINVLVKVPMVQFFNHMAFNNIAQLPGIENKSCIWIRLTLYGYLQFIIMAMPVFIGAFSKYFLIFFLIPAGIVKLMSRIEMLHTSQEHHFQKNFSKLSASQMKM